MKKWVIDAAHGGKDMGVIGALGIKEKDYTLIASNEIKRILEKHNRVVQLTRNGDKYISELERINVANLSCYDIFISIHLNGSTIENTSGTELYISDFNIEPLAKKIMFSLVEGFNSKDNGIYVYKDNILKELNMPYVIVRGDYITNPNIANKFNPVKYGELVAKALLDYN